MSTYVIRHIEVKYEGIDGIIYKPVNLPESAPEGTIYKISSPGHDVYMYDEEKETFGNGVRKIWRPLEELPKDKLVRANCLTYEEMCEKFKDDVKVGDIFTITRGSHRYYKMIDGDWTPIKDNDVKRGWRLLKTYGEIHKSNVYALDSEKETRKRVVIDGKEKVLYEHDYWTNNGGAIRDDYLSDRWGIIDCPFRSRGIPQDISDETMKAMTDKDGKLSGYSHTWATLGEWYSFSNSEETRIMSEIRQAIQKETSKSIEKKLDFIIQNMKDPLKMNLTEIYPKNDNEDEEESDEEYDNIDEIISDGMSKLYLIAQEIAKASLIADFADIYGEDSVRIIYYMES